MEPLVKVNSEIGKLKLAVVHRPGKEMENFTPAMMPHVLFDETPYTVGAQKEHDGYVKLLKDHGVKILYFEDLIIDSLKDDTVKSQFLDQLITEAGYPMKTTLHQLLKEYLTSLDTKSMVYKIIDGVQTKDLDLTKENSFSNAICGNYPYYMDPMPNLIFTRDPWASIGNGMTVNHMTFKNRQPESLFCELVLKHNPLFKEKHIPIWWGRDKTFTHIEGGDEHVLSDHVMAIGISQRTSTVAIKGLAHNLFKHSHFDTILAIHIPHNHALMHLDSVITMANVDQFSVYPGFLKNGNHVDTWTITPGDNGKLHYQYDDNLKSALKRVLHLSQVDFMYTANCDPIQAPREQWNDGANTLSIAPGVVVTYDRNSHTNKTLKEHGLNVLTISSGELSRGRGGPRCMCCPLYREDVNK